MEKICDVDNLLWAYHNARKGKQHRTYVAEYSKNLFDNIVRLRHALLSGEVSMGQYRYFYIYDPKLRKICAADFEERIVHHAIINVCHPYFDRNLIYDSYASRKEKGVYAAIYRARAAMRSASYLAKLDVKSYFDSVSHTVLKQKLRRMFKDKSLLSLFDKIIDSYQSSPGRGIPIGNLTSQYFANFYLSFLDHYIKEELKVPVYIRYMDDMLLFGNTPEQVREYVRKVSAFVTEQLLLILKPPVLGPTRSGVSFLGYSLYPHKILLNRRSKIRFKRKIHEYTRLYLSGQWDDNRYKQHMIPLLAFTQKAYTRRLRLALCRQYS